MDAHLHGETVGGVRLESELNSSSCLGSQSEFIHQSEAFSVAAPRETEAGTAKVQAVAG